MKLRPVITGLLVALFGLAVTASAQETATETNSPPPPAAKNPATKNPNAGGPESRPAREDKGRPERPGRSEDRGGNADAVQGIKNDFRAKADEYVRRQRELMSQYKSANKEERAKIREQLNELKESWKEDRPNLGELLGELRDKVDRETGKGGSGRPR